MTTVKGRPNRFGILVAGAYVLLVVVLSAVIAYYAQPDQVGFEWIPILWLAWPWSYMFMGNHQLIIPGLVANAVTLYVLGTVFEHYRRRIFQK